MTVERTRNLLRAFLICWTLITPAVSYGQSVQNGTNDFAAENRGDEIRLWWAPFDGAEEYVLSYSTSINGPWEVLDTFSKEVVPGGKIHETPDARLMDLCYVVDAKDGSGVVIHTYQPLCVPKYMPSK